MGEDRRWREEREGDIFDGWRGDERGISLKEVGETRGEIVEGSGFDNGGGVVVGETDRGANRELRFRLRRG